MFEGIGGFSLAVDEVFGKENVTHTLVEWDGFCQNVLRKHWPEAELHGDVRAFADAQSPHARRGVRAVSLSHGIESRSEEHGENQTGQPRSSDQGSFTVLTGGFPCQPFSHAGRRKGTADDRYLWPPMFSVIKSLRPEWIIAENVRGLVTWNEGLVLETVCADLESESYEVQPFIIPACAVGAPHRRDRVWIVGYAKHDGRDGTQDRQSGTARGDSNTQGTHEVCQPARPDLSRGVAPHSFSPRLEGFSLKAEGHRGQSRGERPDERWYSWNENWTEVATRLCRMDDGLPKRVARLPDGSCISESRLRKESLKAYGNAIVPQVAVQILKAIKEALELDVH